MPEIKSHTPGAFCWAEVATTDASRTKAFYSELFGWTYEDKPAGAFGTYTMCRSGGKDVAGLYELSPQLLQNGVPPHWMPYVAVASADAACEAVKKHGGTVQQGPFDVMEAGRMAICKDPTAAVFSVWQAKGNQGVSVLGERGTPCWFELSTKGLDRAVAFYKDVFGWGVKKSADPKMRYDEFTPTGAPTPQGGLMELMPEYGPQPPHWKIYFLSEDVDGDTQRAQGLGGSVLVPPMDIPKVGRFSVLADPAGAGFALFQPTPEMTKKAADTRAAAATPKKK